MLVYINYYRVETDKQDCSDSPDLVSDSDLVGLVVLGPKIFYTI